MQVVLYNSHKIVVLCCVCSCVGSNAVWLFAAQTVSRVETAIVSASCVYRCQLWVAVDLIGQPVIFHLHGPHQPDFESSFTGLSPLMLWFRHCFRIFYFLQHLHNSLLFLCFISGFPGKPGLPGSPHFTSSICSGRETLRLSGTGFVLSGYSAKADVLVLAFAFLRNLLVTCLECWC